MGLFDKVTQKATNLGKSVVNSAIDLGASVTTAAREQNELIQLKSQVTVIEQELDALYAQVGRKYIDYALVSGVLLWRTLIPSLEITTKDNRKFNILFSPQDNKKEMYKLVSHITGKEINENSDLKIPFSKKPFGAVIIFLIVGFVIAVIFA